MLNELAGDQYNGPLALHYDVNNTDEAGYNWGVISYDKGSTVLRMLRNLVTEKTYRKALNYFLVDR